MKEFHGIIPPAVTPLNSERELDIPGLERLLEHMISGGVHGIFVLGTTGEGPALGEDQQQLMIRETLRIVRKRVPVLAGISSAAFTQAVSLARFAREAGADAAVAAPPCYFLPGEPELLDFYSALAAEIKMPLFAYNMPGMTKVYMKPAFVARLASIPGIKGYKDSSGNMPDFHELLIALDGREDFSIFVGPEELLGESVLFGADGGVCGGANIAPRIYVEMYNAALQRDIPRMRDCQKKIYMQRRIYSLGRFQSSMIKGVKSALKQMGICDDYMVHPFNHFEPQDAENVGKLLKELNYL